MLSSSFIVNKLRQLPKDRKIKIGDDKAMMICQWHRLQDGTREHSPSFIINIRKNGRYLPGSGHCFSCNKHISDFRVVCDPALENTEAALEDEEDEVVQSLFDEKTIEIFSDEEKVVEIANPIPWNAQEHWRGVNGQLLKLINAKLFFEEEFQNLMAYLPCMVSNQHIGGIKANLRKKGKRNYYNTPGVWVKERGLFPYDTTVSIIKKFKYKTIVIVEGPRDALKCLQRGIPAVAILGTGNWSETKADLVATLDIKRIIVALDGDAAGKRATKKIYSSLKNELEVLRFKFKDGVDPGNCPKAVMDRLKSHVI